jgi:hypothetical protein
MRKSKQGLKSVSSVTTSGRAVQLETAQHLHCVLPRFTQVTAREPRSGRIWGARVSVGPQSDSELLYDWRFTANHFVLATSPLRPTTRIFIFQMNACGYSPYVTSSLTRGWVCRFTIAAGPRQCSHSQLRVPRDSCHILLSQIRDSLHLEGQVPVFISSRNRVARL